MGCRARKKSRKWHFPLVLLDRWGTLPPTYLRKCFIFLFTPFLPLSPKEQKKNIKKTSFLSALGPISCTLLIVGRFGKRERKRAKPLWAQLVRTSLCLFPTPPHPRLPPLLLLYRQQWLPPTMATARAGPYKQGGSIRWRHSAPSRIEFLVPAHPTGSDGRCPVYVLYMALWSNVLVFTYNRLNFHQKCIMCYWEWS